MRFKRSGLCLFDRLFTTETVRRQNFRCISRIAVDAADEEDRAQAADQIRGEAEERPVRQRDFIEERVQENPERRQDADHRKDHQNRPVELAARLEGEGETDEVESREDLTQSQVGREDPFVNRARFGQVAGKGAHADEQESRKHLEEPVRGLRAVVERVGREDQAERREVEPQVQSQVDEAAFRRDVREIESGQAGQKSEEHQEGVAENLNRALTCFQVESSWQEGIPAGF